MRSLRRSSALLAISLVLVPLAACEKEDAKNLADVLYSQRANCYLFDRNPTGSPHTTTSAGKGMFMVYTIDRVETRGLPLTLTRAKLHAGGDKTQNALNSSLGQFMTFQDQTIPPNTVKTNLGRIIVNVEVDGVEPAGLKTERADLSYDNLNAAGEVEPPMFVLPHVDGPDEPVFLDPCTPQNLPS